MSIRLMVDMIAVFWAAAPNFLMSATMVSVMQVGFIGLGTMGAGMVAPAGKVYCLGVQLDA